MSRQRCVTNALIGKRNAYLMKPIIPEKLHSELEESGLIK